MPLFLWRRLGDLARTLVLLLFVIGLFITYRVVTFSQADDPERTASKQKYLAELASNTALAADAPNLVFVLYDDMGYGDIGAGADSNLINTPHIDQLAANGIVLSDFHAPAAMCTPSRAGYLTGRLPPRAGMPSVVFPSGSAKELIISVLMNPDANHRLPEEEITLADILGAAGYATGMVGKWHLGDRSPSLPNDMGFDSYYGALYSNDMEPFALYRNTAVEIEAPVDQRYLTQHYTEAATAFIQDQGDRPFFLYFAHNFPHDPLHVRDARKGQSNGGLYGDVLEEIDDSIGQIIEALEATGALDNTLIIISSDNGPWYLGDAGNLRGRKGSTFEGGMRVPFIAHWPKAIPAGSNSNAMAMGTDLVPTLLDILKLPAPGDRLLDGRSLLGVLTRNEPTPHEYLYFYAGEQLIATRNQRFKYRRPHGAFYNVDQVSISGAAPQKEWLFDLSGSQRESYDTSLRHPDELQRLSAALSAKEAEMAKNKRGWQ